MFSISISTSKNITLYLLLIHGLMLATLLSLIEISWWSLLVFLLTVLSYRSFHKKTNAISKIERDADNNNWHCHYRNENVQESLRLTSSVVTPIFVILYFKDNTIWQRSTIVMADAVDAELFRQLRVFCRDPKAFQK